jgi:hypothetical protein
MSADAAAVAAAAWAAGRPLPEGITPDSSCEKCGDLVAWCPEWTKKFPWLEQHR